MSSLTLQVGTLVSKEKRVAEHVTGATSRVDHRDRLQTTVHSNTSIWYDVEFQTADGLVLKRSIHDAPRITHGQGIGFVLDDDDQIVTVVNLDTGAKLAHSSSLPMGWLPSLIKMAGYCFFFVAFALVAPFLIAYFGGYPTVANVLLGIIVVSIAGWLILDRVAGPELPDTARNKAVDALAEKAVSDWKRNKPAAASR